MTPNEIMNKRFDKGMGGYKADEVQSFLASIAGYVKDILEEKSELEQKIMVLAEKLEEYREDEDSLRAALIGAQKLGDSVVRESKNKAEAILKEAQKKADAMVAQIRQNVENETYALNKMQAEVAKFKKQIITMYTSHIELLNAIPYEEEDFTPPVPPPVMPQKPGLPEDAFALKFEQVEETAQEEAKSAGLSKNGPRHQNLNMFFGEKAPVTRKD